MPSEGAGAKAARATSGLLGHPLHPILVTVPIGAFVSSLLFDLLSLTGGRDLLVDGAYWLIGIGLVAAVVAALFGVLDLLTIPRGTPAFGTGLRHATLNALALGVFAIDFAWRATDHLEHEKTPAGQLALSAVAVGVLTVSAWLGGKLVYRYGVRVADDKTRVEGFEERDKGSTA